MSVKYCFPSLELIFGLAVLLQTCQKRTESGDPEAFKIDTSQAGEIEKREIVKFHLEVVFMAYIMSKAFKETWKRCPIF